MVQPTSGEDARNARLRAERKLGDTRSRNPWVEALAQRLEEMAEESRCALLGFRGRTGT